jgi:hypothetical protein
MERPVPVAFVSIGVVSMSIETPVTPSIVPGDTAAERIDAGEPISPSPYSAKLLGWSDEELASSDFFRLVDAIRWLSDAEQNGALAKRAGIYSATGELVWARTFVSDRHEQRERVMKYNALRILVQVD